MPKSKGNASKLNDCIDKLFHVLTSTQKVLSPLPSKFNFQDFKSIYYTGRNPGIMQCDLATHLMVTAGNTSIIISKLVRNKLIQKKRLENNQRAVQLTLTVEGKKIYSTMLTTHLQFCESILKKLNVNEQKMFLTLFNKITT